MTPCASQKGGLQRGQNEPVKLWGECIRFVGGWGQPEVLGLQGQWRVTFSQISQLTSTGSIPSCHLQSPLDPFGVPPLRPVYLEPLSLGVSSPGAGH